MSVEAPADLLRRPADEAARRVALGHLAQADAAAGRLADTADAADEEALHDFRVAVRRLRSALRAHRAVLGDALRRKDRRRLRRLARATNAGREAEVALAWLEARRGDVPRAARSGVDALCAQLLARKEEEYARARREVVAEHRRLAAALRRRLAAYQIAVDLDRETALATLAESVAPLLRQQAARLASDLAAVAGPDGAELHRARISGKRLRYLLEPLRPELPEAGAVVERLKRLQDVLGELHDLQVLGAMVRERLAAAAAERARARFALAVEEGSASRAVRRAVRRGLPGALAVADLLRARREELWRDLQDSWLSGASGALGEEIEGLAAGLREKTGTGTGGS